MHDFFDALLQGRVGCKLARLTLRAVGKYLSRSREDCLITRLKRHLGGHNFALNCFALNLSNSPVAVSGVN